MVFEGFLACSSLFWDFPLSPGVSFDWISLIFSNRSKVELRVRLLVELTNFAKTLAIELSSCAGETKSYIIESIL